MVIYEVFRLGPSTSTPVVQLVEVLNEVLALISDSMFYGTKGVLTSVATHHLDLDFTTIYSGYADGWSIDEIHALGESLVPHAQMVDEQVTVQWVMEARCSFVAEDVRQKDVIQPLVGVDTGSEVSVVLPLIEPNVIPTRSELPSSLSIILTADATGRP